jgi:hypothetical protein
MPHYWKTRIGNAASAHLLDAKRVQLEVQVRSGAQFDLGTRDHDYFIIVAA